MDAYVDKCMAEFTKYYNWLSKSSQRQMIKYYVWRTLYTILGIKTWKEYCEMIVNKLVSQWKSNVWQQTYDQLVYAIECFFWKRRNKIYNKLQRMILNWILIEVRARQRQIRKLKSWKWWHRLS